VERPCDIEYTKLFGIFCRRKNVLKPTDREQRTIKMQSSGESYESKESESDEAELPGVMIFSCLYP
jgi:hypothetical protein